MAGGGPTWPAYLDRFHRERAGITEEVLTRTVAAGQDPYTWLAGALAPGAVVLDVACGSGPVAARHAGGWVGVDRSATELAAVRRDGRPALRADAARLPVAGGSLDAASCSMALMILQPLDAVLAELHRVLRPGATLVALLPGSRPLTATDLARYGRLMVALRRTHLGYPNDRHLARLARRVAGAGFSVVDDERRRFALPFHTTDDTARFVRSLYLPGVAGGRLGRAEAVAAGWVGSDLGVPLRRATLRRAP